MSSNALRLGRIRGIEISVHWSWLIIFALITWSLATAFFPSFFPEWSVSTSWIVGAITAVLLFVSVLLHELGHSFVALAEGIPVKSITLFVFGGVSNIEAEPKTPGGEFWMAIAGPLVSLAIAGLCYALLRLVGGDLPSVVLGILLALAFYNLTLAVFNLVPAFPLDGGRVLRSIVWAITHSFRRATAIATTIGHVFGYLFIVVGVILAFFEGNFLSGLWLVFIGMFLNNAADMARRQVQLSTELAGIRVGSVMRANPPVVPADTSLADFVESYVLARNLRALPVVSEPGQLVGLVTLAEVRPVPRDQWGIRTVGEVMIPASRLTVTHPDEPLEQALQGLSRNDLNQLPVVQNGALVGLLTRSDVIRFLQIRQELQPAA